MVTTKLGFVCTHVQESESLMYICMCVSESVFVYIWEKESICVYVDVCRRVSEHIQETTALHLYLYVSQRVCVCTFGKRLGYTCMHVHVCVHIWERKKPWLLDEREADLQCVCVQAWHRKLHHMCMCVRESVCVCVHFGRERGTCVCVYIYTFVCFKVCVLLLIAFYTALFSAVDQTLHSCCM